MWPRGQRARIWVTAAAVVLIAVTVVWLRAAGDPKAASTRASHRIVNGPPLATGASFSVNVTSFSRDADARVMAGRLTKAGLPSFAWRLNGSLRDVLVGPFVSIDEAEAAQGEVARLGYPRGRLHVDERLRGTGTVALAAEAKANPAVVLVAAPGRLAVAFELAEEPQEVSGRRIDSTTFAVTDQRRPVDRRAGVERAVRRAAREARQRGGRPARRARSRSPGDRGGERRGDRASAGRARVRGRGARAARVRRAAGGAGCETGFDRVRIAARDGARGTTAGAIRVRAACARIGADRSGILRDGRSSYGAASPGDVGQYRQAIGPVFARFEEIQPFLRSAVATPTPEVLAAIAGTFAELEQTLRATDVPRAAQGAHGLLLSAIQLARGAVVPSFTGDRMTQVREAMAQFQAAKAQLR